ncbi:hypothetical protein [Actinomadura madurae]|uniref:hypothetical protein n=1 Tax=Actinomadura madurae TaxID=1993 RepID=UPI0020D22266|nr:hypothetical protein [Actinomadura madurae]MCP9968778.1 hypothetical protein [Actinomadura madurae]MCQ0017462.1 hypothetical protein [Actinomadura madurae]
MTGTVTAVEGRVSVLGVAKGARDAEGIEDACWPPEPVSAAGPVVRLALADGVSDSYRPGPWARDLVRAFGTRAPLRATTDPAEFAEVLRRQCAAWAPRLRGYVRDEREGRHLPWWEKRKLRAGSAATVLVVCVCGDGVWTAAALGDTCVFHVSRDGRAAGRSRWTTPAASTRLPRRSRAPTPTGRPCAGTSGCTKGPGGPATGSSWPPTRSPSGRSSGTPATATRGGNSTRRSTRGTPTRASSRGGWRSGARRAPCATTTSA